MVGLPWRNFSKSNVERAKWVIHLHASFGGDDLLSVWLKLLLSISMPLFEVPTVTGLDLHVRIRV